MTRITLVTIASLFGVSVTAYADHLIGESRYAFATLLTFVACSTWWAAVFIGYEKESA